MKDRPEFDPDNKDDKLYTTKDVAELFSVTTETVRDWISAGKLPGTQLPTGQYRVRRADLMVFAKSQYGA